MTDNCFVCLEKCKNRICSTCSCRAHKKCLGKYIKASDRNQTPKCPVCKNELEKYKRPTTRLSTEKNRWNEFKETIRYLLFHIERADSQNERQIAKIMFDFTYENRYLVKKKSKKLLDTIVHRLKYLYTENRWGYAQHLMYKFRNEF